MRLEALLTQGWVHHRKETGGRERERETLSLIRRSDVFVWREGECMDNASP